jgi:hypothetical protein
MLTAKTESILAKGRGNINILKKCTSIFTFFTDKKGNQIFLINREIQNGADSKSYMTNGLLIYGEIFAHFLIY